MLELARWFEPPKGARHFDARRFVILTQDPGRDNLVIDKLQALGYNRIMSIKLETSNLFVTFKTQKEATDYIEMHIPEEKRLLWMGFMFGCNYSANQVNENFILKKK